MATIITARTESALQYLSPLQLGRNLWRQRSLIRQFTRREIEGRYRGSFLGLFWSFVNPLVMLLIYTFVFGVIFKARWPQAKTNSLGEFAVVLFCGLIAFNTFSECVNRSSGLIFTVPNYVKKVVFPLEILPVSVLGSALFHLMVSLSILMVANLLISGTVYWTLLLLPLVALPLIFLSLGLAWFLASLGVFVRDVTYTVTLVVQVLFFLTPIVYSIDTIKNIPGPLRLVMRLNPMASIVENFRRVVLWGQQPSWIGLALWLLGTGTIMVLGYAWFMKTKKAFADVI
jgi:homopolymeric O-antigen transport system permease protein